jgi:hypothetical protein
MRLLTNEVVGTSERKSTLRPGKIHSSIERCGVMLEFTSALITKLSILTVVCPACPTTHPSS